jgi:hypothetical protein
MNVTTNIGIIKLLQEDIGNIPPMVINYIRLKRIKI